MVADTGSGQIVLAILIALVFSFGWCICLCALRWTGPDLRFSKGWIALFVLALALMMLSPPMRKRGVWLDEAGARAGTVYADELDRFYFGYMPTWNNIMRLGDVEPLATMNVHGQTPIPIHTTVGIAPRADHTLRAIWWGVDWTGVAVQAGIIGSLFLPFLVEPVSKRGVRNGPSE